MPSGAGARGLCRTCISAGRRSFWKPASSAWPAPRRGRQPRRRSRTWAARLVRWRRLASWCGRTGCSKKHDRGWGGMRSPAAERLEIIRLVEGSPLPVRHTPAKLGTPGARFFAGRSGIAKAGSMPWRTERRARSGCGTAFHRRCATASSGSRSTSRPCRRASWRPAAPTRETISSRRLRCSAGAKRGAWSPARRSS